MKSLLIFMFCSITINSYSQSKYRNPEQQFQHKLDSMLNNESAKLKIINDTLCLKNKRWEKVMKSRNKK